ncbi:MAG: A/G-specific adenine glycosylase [Thermodesulfobacteriota bacterium]|nr:A/G-specific adenine glycosylase [Thermodesulfobacteriota bacterium]
MTKVKKYTSSEISKFQKVIYQHYGKEGRTLPWRETRNPYYILVSEIMLQQTQVERVIEKYQKFIALFPDIETLDRSPLQKILKVWQGLGYNRRALALKKIARIIVEDYKGEVPRSLEELVKLPGIGQTTASEIAAFAFNQPTVFIETNIRSVFLHYFFSERDDVSDEELIPLVAKTVDRSNPREWYYALMDYGVFLKKQYENPSRKSTHYYKQSPFNGSNRQIRGKIVKYLTENHSSTGKQIARDLQIPYEKAEPNLLKLEKEGFLIRKGKRLTIA